MVLDFSSVYLALDHTFQQLVFGPPTTVTISDAHLSVEKKASVHANSFVCRVKISACCNATAHIGWGIYSIVDM